MTRNNDRAAALGAAIGPPSRTKRDEPYALAGYARALAKLQHDSEDWASLMHQHYQQGHLRPRKEPIDADKIVLSVSAQYAPQALASAVRGENELRVKALLRATRILSASPDPKRQKMAADLARFLGSEWGVRRAADAVGGNDRDTVQELREKWGDAQLPPEGEMVGAWSADYLLVENAVRRLS
jgi:hypothetical protein